MIILLVGLMGSGRTSIGSCLADSLKFEFLELEDLVLKKTGFKSYDEAYKGKLSKWKEAEIELTKEIAAKNNIVLTATSTYIDNDINIHIFKESGKDVHIIYLRTNPEVITQRLTTLYTGFKKEGAKRIMKRVQEYHMLRDTLFSHHADFIIDTDDKIPEVSCKHILKMVEG